MVYSVRCQGVVDVAVDQTCPSPSRYSRFLC